MATEVASAPAAAEYDCIVVGAGVEGSAAAYKLAEAGQKTLLLEQFELGHENGSSHGGSRITRLSYATPCFNLMAMDIFQEWANIERLVGKTLFVRSGLLTTGQKPCPMVEGVATNLRRQQVNFRLVTGSEQLRSVMPQSTFPDDHYGVYEEGAGVLLASTAVGCLQQLASKYGGKILDKCKVVDIVPGPSLVVVHAQDGREFRAKNLVICAGTWAGLLAKKLGLRLPLTPIRCSVAYWKEHSVASHSPDNGMPCVIDANGFYALPSIEYPGYVKIAAHGGYEYDIQDMDDHQKEKDVDARPTYQLDRLTQYVASRFPGLDSSAPSFVQKCKYTMTPDELFILDKHPRHANIFFGAGFSGTGFKMAPVVGNILRDFVLDVKHKYDLDNFRIDRFGKISE